MIPECEARFVKKNTRSEASKRKTRSVSSILEEIPRESQDTLILSPLYSRVLARLKTCSLTVSCSPCCFCEIRRHSLEDCTASGELAIISCATESAAGRRSFGGTI